MKKVIYCLLPVVINHPWSLKQNREHIKEQTVEWQCNLRQLDQTWPLENSVDHKEVIKLMW